MNKVGEKRWKILFVDDESNLLSSLRRSLRKQQNWEMFYESSGSKAIELLSQQKISVVVADMRMPDMDGAELLNRSRKIAPHTIRFVLSGDADRETVFRIVSCAHIFLSKPCAIELLLENLNRAVSLHSILENSPLLTLVNEIGGLPVIPTLYGRLVDNLQSDDASIDAVGSIIADDISMTTKILQLVNSAFFGLPREIYTPQEAAVLLGLDVISVLVLSLELFSQFDDQTMKNFKIEELWVHMQRTAAIAKAIAKYEGCSNEQVRTIYISALLHDIGKVIFVKTVPDQVEEILESDDLTLLKSDRKIMNVSCDEIGAYILGLWGLPSNVVKIILSQNELLTLPEEESEILFSTKILHIANYFDTSSRAGSDESNTNFGDEYLSKIGLLEKAKEWEQVLTDFS